MAHSTFYNFINKNVNLDTTPCLNSCQMDTIFISPPTCTSNSIQGLCSTQENNIYSLYLLECSIKTPKIDENSITNYGKNSVETKGTYLQGCSTASIAVVKECLHDVGSHRFRAQWITRDFGFLRNRAQGQQQNWFSLKEVQIVVAIAAVLKLLAYRRYSLLTKLSISETERLLCSR